MAQTANPLAPASPAGVNLMSIDPKNWHRYPPPVADMTRANATEEAKPAYDSMDDWTGGLANEGAAADNAGEHGTQVSTHVSRGQPWNHQEGKAAALGLDMAVDVTKSYHGTRGDIEPFEPYPTTAPVVASSENIAPVQALDARRYPRQTVRSEDTLPENQKDLRRG